MTKVVAIHQPNFFPWLGFFTKIMRSDVFVLLDDVQFQKTGGTWTNRVQLLVSGKAHWVTAPIVRSHHGVRNINEMHFNSTDNWRSKMIATISMNYRKAPFFEASMPVLKPLIEHPDDNIAAYNCHAIQAILDHLNIKHDHLISSSELPHEGKANNLLISLTKAVEGDTYLSGDGADGYQNPELFQEAGIALQYLHFKHPQYPQHGVAEFVPGLSILDALMNIGFANTQSLLVSAESQLRNGAAF